MLIFLVGYMGCGKSTLGRHMAQELNYKYIDTDTLIEKKYDATIPQIFVLHGEDRFREMEREAVQSLDESENAVVSTGGGLPCHNENIELLNSKGFTIYIEVPEELLLKRISKTSSKRPLLAHKTPDEMLDFVKDSLDRRRPYYQQAKMKISGGHIQAHDIVQLMNMTLQYSQTV
ncbi:MAG: shikimate kinase [Bacteroidetes bacterium]|nr:shikimate kinase [Bacteroidota bacterium]